MVNYWLILHNTICIISFISCLSVGILVYIKNPLKSINRVFFITNLSTAFFYLFHFLGVNAVDVHWATIFLNTNWINLIATLLSAHLILETIGQTKKYKRSLIIAYIINIGLTIFFILRPELMLGTPISKFHMPFYYVPGPLYLFMRLCAFCTVSYFMVIALRVYSKSQTDERVRYNYLLYAFLYAFTLIGTTLLPIYNINFPPAITMLFGGYTLLFAYGIFKYELFNVSIIAKRALVYGLIMTTVSLSIIGINVISANVSQSIPDFPSWLIPLLSGIITTIVGILIWNKFKEIDVLKYEFISVVSHKFRTPLTAIKWSMNMLRDPKVTPDEHSLALEQIEQSEQKMIELVEVIVDTYHSDNIEYEYKMHRQDFRDVLNEVLSTQIPIAKRRNIRIATQSIDQALPVSIDKDKIKFVLQTLIENAINYSPDASIIKVVTIRENNWAVCSIQDSGIGMDKEDMSKIFSKFYRGNQARAKDTEGMGVGLSLAHDIIVRHGGDISAKSEGKDMGSVFTVKLPLVK